MCQCRPHSHEIAPITTAVSHTRKRAGQSQGTTAEAKEKSGGNESQHNLKVMRTTLPAPFQTPPPRSQQCDPPKPRETTRKIELSVRAYRAAHESLFMSHPIRPAPSPHNHRTPVKQLEQTTKHTTYKLPMTRMFLRHVNVTTLLNRDFVSERQHICIV